MPAPADLNASNLRRYERIAPLYDFIEQPFERLRHRPLRRELFDGLKGRILDAGVGTGFNFPFYPMGATVLGIDISPGMLARAERKRRRSPAQSISLCRMDVTGIAVADHAFDAAVASFLFCILPESLQASALIELARVVRPGGVIRMLDYARPQQPARRRIAQLWSRWIEWAFGAQFDARTEDHIRDIGLIIARKEFISGGLLRLIEIQAPQNQNCEH